MVGDGSTLSSSVMMARTSKGPSRAVIALIVSVAAILGIGIITAPLLFLRQDDLARAAREADSAAAAYRASGMPWVAKDLRPDLPLPPGQDAAPTLYRAIKLLAGKDFQKNGAGIPKSIEFGSISAATRFLKPYDAALNEAVKAAQFSDVDFKRDWDLGPDLLLPEYAQMKTLAKGLCYRAELECRMGRPQAAAEDLKASWRLGNLAYRDPMLIGMLVRIAIEAITNRSLQHCVYFSRSDATGLKELASVLQGAEAPSFAYALRSEAYMGLACIRNLRAFGGVNGLADASSGDSAPPPPDPKTLVRTGLPTDMQGRAFAARHLQLWRGVKGLIDRYPRDPIGLSQAMQHLEDQIEARKKLSYALEAVLLPVYDQAGIAVVKEQAEICATQAMAAAVLACAKGGKVPSKIADIPGKWIDPFTGGPMRVRRDGKWFRVYSLGPKRKDFGGVYQRELTYDKSQDYNVGAAFGPLKQR